MVTEPEKRDPELDAVEAKILRQRDELLAERARLMEMRQDLLNRLRYADRRLADCRATARFFGLNVAFPDDESEQIERIERERIERERSARIAERRYAMHQAELAERNAQTHFALVPSGPARRAAEPAAPIPSSALPAKIMIDSNVPIPKTVRTVILERLEAAGLAGLKAATIRDYYERTYGKTVHQKTIGMTLYRLQNDGLVRHEGHFWFFVPPDARTKNPGGETPGPINSDQP